MTLTGYSSTNLPLDLLLDSGVLYIASTKFGVTKGAPKFNPNRTWDNVGFDGKQAPLKLLDRPFYGPPTISLTAMEFGNASSGAQISKYEPTAVTSSVTGVVTHTPVSGGAFLATGGYITDLRILWERGIAGGSVYFAVYFPYALCTKYEISGVDKGNPIVSCEFEGRLVESAAASDPPYKFEYRTVLP